MLHLQIENNKYIEVKLLIFVIPLESYSMIDIIINIWISFYLSLLYEFHFIYQT